MLCSSGVASYSSDTTMTLESKRTFIQATHPYRTPSFSESPLVMEIDNVNGCIKLFPKRTPYRRGGLRAQHILDALSGEGFVVAIYILRAIIAMVNLWLEGICPLSLAKFVTDTLWRHLVSKVAMKGVGNKISKYVNDFNLG